MAAPRVWFGQDLRRLARHPEVTGTIVQGYLITDPDVLADLGIAPARGRASCRAGRGAPRLMARLDEAGLDAYTDRFVHDAFRHEVLTRYDVTSDGGGFARYLAGEPEPDPEGGRPWARWVRRQIDRGATVRRLRVLTAPPGAYLRFEMEWAYTANVAAGEQIRVLDLTAQPRPAALVDAEFWMLDGERAVLMHYDEAGRFVLGDSIEGQAAEPIRHARDTGWAAAEPFEQWWARHPRYHRDPSRARA